jgi:hypothetical protein
MNIRALVAAPFGDGREPADFAPHTISINKANGNMLINDARNLIFHGHDYFFPTRPSSIYL